MKNQYRGGGGLGKKEGVVFFEKLGSLKQPKIPATFSCNTVYCPISHELKATRQLNMVRSQVIECNTIFFFKNLVENEAERVLPDLFFKKALYELSVCRLASLYFSSPKLVYNKKQTV